MAAARALNGKAATADAPVQLIFRLQPHILEAFLTVFNALARGHRKGAPQEGAAGGLRRRAPQEGAAKRVPQRGRRKEGATKRAPRAPPKEDGQKGGATRPQ
eukprot:gene10474-2135_t